MHSLNLDFIDLFTKQTAQEGLDYFRLNKVISLELDDDFGLLSGQVRGSEGRVYQVDIGLNPHPDDPDEDPISCECSCPMVLNCKHVCALLLKAEQSFGADRINQLLEIGNRYRSELALREMITELAQSFTSEEDLQILEELKAQLEQNLPDILNEGGLHLSSAEESRLEINRNQWLKQLKTPSKPEPEPSHAEQPSTNRSATNCLVYF